MLCKTCRFAQTIVGVGFRCHGRCEHCVVPLGSNNACAGWKLGRNKWLDVKTSPGIMVDFKRVGEELPWEGEEKDLEFNESLNAGDFLIVNERGACEVIDDRRKANAIVIPRIFLGGADYAYLTEIRTGRVKLDPAFMEKYGLEGPPSEDEMYEAWVEFLQNPKSYTKDFEIAFEAGWKARGEDVD